MISQATRERDFRKLEIEYSFIAIRPFKAEHPVGSGTVVDYAPGDIVPASDWGNAAHNMMEMGKIERLAINVDRRVAPPAPKPEEKAVTYPLLTGGGWWVLSNGERVRGKKAIALEAERNLGASDE